MPYLARKNHIATTEQLELRILPTVKVNLNPNNGLLKITGDNADNNIEIHSINNDFGHIEIFVDKDFAGEFEDVTSIKANLKGGDDLLSLPTVKIFGDLLVKFGGGKDFLKMGNSSNVSPQTAFLGGELKADFGNDPGDRAEFDNNVSIDDDVTFTGVADVDFDGAGTTPFSEVGQDVLIFGNLNIQLSGFGDVDGDNLELDLDNVVVRLDSLIQGSNSIDRIEMSSVSFSGGFFIDLRGGNDVLDIAGGFPNRNLFNLTADFRGGNGDDTLLKGLDNTFADPELITGFETVV